MITSAPRLSALALLIGLGLPACTWVSSKDVDDRRPDLDDDADGYIASQDCDDLDGAINPGATETWYDGIDSDCARDDDYDADADGYVPADYAGLPTAEVQGSGSLPGGDCDDARAEVNPDGSDSWYDGEDTDCSGNDDYDQDGDGYVQDSHEGLTTQYADGTGGLPAGDCDDETDSVNPGQADSWYDGEDTDCSGNDDYDQDGDGFVQDSDAGKATTYVDGSGGLPAGDCNDEDLSIYPEAPDTWYDGIDSDCMEDDDYDQDLDGFQDPSQPDGLGTDCDDTDDDAYPGNTEVLSDGTDQDCDGADSTFVVDAVEGLTWQGPHDLRFGENSSSIYLSVAAEQITYGVTEYYDSALALTWDSTAPNAGSTGILVWLMNLSDPTFSLTQGHSLLVTDDEILGAVGLTYTSSGNRSLRFGGYDLGTGGRFGVNTPTTTYAPFEDIAVASGEDGYLYAVGCEATDGVGRYVRATRDQLPTTYETTEEVPRLDATACTLHFFDTPTGALVSSQDAGLTTVPFDSTSDAPFADIYDCLAATRSGGGSASPADTGSTDTGSTDTGGTDTGTTEPCEDPTTVDPDVRATDVETVPDKPWLLLADVASDQVVIVFPSGTELALSVTDPMHAQATVGPDNTIYIAYVDGDGTPGLAWGTSALGFEQITLDPGFTATEAVVEVNGTGDALVYAVLGTDAVAVGTAAID